MILRPAPLLSPDLRAVAGPCQWLCRSHHTAAPACPVRSWPAL